MKNGLYSNFCICGAHIPTPAINRFGDLPEVFCSSVCETNAKEKKRMYTKEINAHRSFGPVAIKLPGMTPRDIINQFGGVVKEVI